MIGLFILGVVAGATVALASVALGQGPRDLRPVIVRRGDVLLLQGHRQRAMRADRTPEGDLILYTQPMYSSGRAGPSKA